MKKAFKIILTTTVCLTLLVGFLFRGDIYNIWLIKSGSVVEKDFKTEIPYQLKSGHIIIPVYIDGEKLKFMFDTGALNVISKTTAEKLGIRQTSDIVVNGSQGNQKEQGLTKIAKIEIGGIQFINTAAVIKNSENNCFDLDGIIGSNLLKNAVWKIDRKNHIITLASSIEKFDLDSYQYQIPFSTDIQGTPETTIILPSGNKLHTLVDTGFYGWIKIDRKYRDSISKSSIKGTVVILGNVNTGTFGKRKSTSNAKYFSKISEFAIGNLNIKNHIVFFGDHEYEGTIGSAFLRNYNTIIDWESRKIYLEDIGVRDTISYSSYGFGKNFIDGKVVISRLVKSSSAAELMELGDQIIAYQGEDWRQLTQTDWCTIRNMDNPESITMKIKHGDKIRTVSLKKTVFIE